MQFDKSYSVIGSPWSKEREEICQFLVRGTLPLILGTIEFPLKLQLKIRIY